MLHENLTLSKIIQYNTDFKDVPDNVMFSSQHCSGVRNHQCIPKPTLTKPTCPTPTDTATPRATTNGQTNQPVQISTGTTNQPTTIAASTSAAPTVVTVTESPCCSQRDSCAVEKANLTKLADELTKNQTQLKMKVGDLEMDLNHEKVCEHAGWMDGYSSVSYIELLFSATGFTSGECFTACSVGSTVYFDRAEQGAPFECDKRTGSKSHCTNMACFSS